MNFSIFILTLFCQLNVVSTEKKTVMMLSRFRVFECLHYHWDIMWFSKKEAEEWNERESFNINLMGVYYSENINQIITLFRFKLLSFELNIIFKEGFTLDIFFPFSTNHKRHSIENIGINISLIFSIFDNSSWTFHFNPTNFIPFPSNLTPAEYKLKNLYSSLKCLADQNRIEI